MSSEQAGAAVIIALISEENMSKKKKQKRKVWKHGLKERKTLGFRILWNSPCRTAEYNII